MQLRHCGSLDVGIICMLFMDRFAFLTMYEIGVQRYIMCSVQLIFS